MLKSHCQIFQLFLCKSLFQDFQIMINKVEEELVINLKSLVIKVIV